MPGIESSFPARYPARYRMEQTNGIRMARIFKKYHGFPLRLFFQHTLQQFVSP